MRYLLLLLLSLSLLTVQAQSDSRPLVVASASIFADMANVIAGDHLRVDMVVPIGGDPHIYEPTPDDVRLVSAPSKVKNTLIQVTLTPG